MKKLATVLVIWGLLFVMFQPDASSVSSVRLGGEDRYETSALISEYQYPNGADTVYLANGRTMVDSLSVDPVDGPVLLVSRDRMHPSVYAEIRRLKPSTVVVLGSGDVVSSDIQEQAERAAIGLDAEAFMLNLSMGSDQLPLHLHLT